MRYRSLAPLIVALFIAAGLALWCQGCDPDSLDSAHDIDRCLNREVFNECMASLPAGPERTHYNDWAEVVEACGNRAWSHSYRLKRDIPAGCR